MRWSGLLGFQDLSVASGGEPVGARASEGHRTHARFPAGGPEVLTGGEALFLVTRRDGAWRLQALSTFGI